MDAPVKKGKEIEIEDKKGTRYVLEKIYTKK